MDIVIKSKELTKRELETLKHICLPVSEIAEIMHVSVATVKGFKLFLRSKLNASNDIQILTNALKRGVVSIDEITTVEIERD